MKNICIHIWKNLPAIFCLAPFIMILGTVFIVDNSFINATVTGKYFWFYLGMGLCSVSTLILYLIRRKPFKPMRVDWGVLVFCLLGAINQLYTNSGYLSTRFVLFLLCCILYFYFRIGLQQYKWISSVLVLFFLMTALTEIIWGLLQLYGYLQSWNYLFKITGSFFNPGPFGGYVAMIVPWAFYYILADSSLMNIKFKGGDWFRHIRFWLSLLICLGAVLILPAVMSRASWIALLSGCGLVFVLFFGRKAKEYIVKQWKKQRQKVVALISIIIVLIYIGFSGMYYLKKDSADGRKLMWKISLITIWEHKAGVGLGNFSGYYGESQAEYFKTGKGTEKDEWVAGCPDYAFNEYLQIGVELGIPALLVFIFLILSTLYTGIRQMNIAPIGALFSLLVFASMSYPFNVLPFVIVLVFLMTLSVTRKENEEKRTTSNNNLQSNTLLILIFIIPVVFLLLYNRYPTYQAYKEWIIAEKYYSSGMSERAVTIYEKNIPYLEDQVGFLYEYSDVLAALNRKTEAIPVLEVCARLSCDPIIYHRIGKDYQDMGMYGNAEEIYQKSADIIPQRIYPYYLLAKLYMETKDSEKAAKMAGIVINKIPKVESQRVREMKKEMRMYLDNIEK